MANTLVQFRADEETRIEAVAICNKLGIDLATYFRICMLKLIQEKGIPFSMKLDSSASNPGTEALKRASLMAEKAGVSEMTLDEINQEISEARKKG